jgi:hypothetical protein
VSALPLAQEEEMKIEPGFCACGKPLHYSDETLKGLIDKFIEDKGEFQKVTTTTGVYKVQRHYMALHGIKEHEMPELARQGIVERMETPT